HVGKMPTFCGRNLTIPFLFEFLPKGRVLDMLKSREPIRQRTHIAAALHVALAAKRIQSAAVFADMAGEKRKVYQRKNVIDRVVVFGDAERPANHCTVCAGVRVGNGFYYFSRDS